MKRDFNRQRTSKLTIHLCPDSDGWLKQKFITGQFFYKRKITAKYMKKQSIKKGLKKIPVLNIKNIYQLIMSFNRIIFK